MKRSLATEGVRTIDERKCSHTYVNSSKIDDEV